MRLIALSWLVLGMSVPASAWTMHEAAHGATQVAPGTHHHHDDDGGISVPENDDGDIPDGGHDHMPCLSLGAVTVPDDGADIVAFDHARAIFIIPVASGAVSDGTDALQRPPRFG